MNKIFSFFLKPFLSKKDSSSVRDKHFPFVLTKMGNKDYSIAVNIEGDELYPAYFDFFQKHGYEGNGYCWEGHIKQILEKLDSDLLEQIDFDSEAGGFYAYTESKKAQLRFAALLSPIFSDLAQLEEWVKKADRDRMDD